MNLSNLINKGKHGVEAAERERWAQVFERLAEAAAAERREAYIEAARRLREDDKG